MIGDRGAVGNVSKFIRLLLQPEDLDDQSGVLSRWLGTGVDPVCPS